jgi:hypothetical protein
MSDSDKGRLEGYLAGRNSSHRIPEASVSPVAS